MRQRWSMHCCALDAECVRFGGPWRLEINSPWWHLGIALKPSDKYAHIDGHDDWIYFRRWATS